MTYIYQNPDWHNFCWRGEKLEKLLFDIKKAQGYLLGKMQVFGFEVQNSANLKILTEDIVKTSEIEGELLNRKSVCSSIARKLGISEVQQAQSTRSIDGIVEMMLDAAKNHNKPITKERLLGWHGFWKIFYKQ